MTTAHFSGDWVTLEVPNGLGVTASLWMSVDDLLSLSDQARKHQEAESERKENAAWDRLICDPRSVT